MLKIGMFSDALDVLSHAAGAGQAEHKGRRLRGETLRRSSARERLAPEVGDVQTERLGP